MLRLSQISNLTGLKRHALNARVKTLFKDEELTRSPGNQILLKSSQIKQVMHDKINEDSGKVIYIGNLKGGVGKTTISYLLIKILSSFGLKICAIDLDVQSNLTSQFIALKPDQPVFFDIIDNKKCKLSDIIISLSDTLDLIPSSLKNSLIQKSLSMQAPKHHLDWFNNLCLEELRLNYNIIIVDTPPHLTTLNSVFCLCLKNNDHIVIPACADEFSIMGVEMFLEDILSIRASYKVNSNPKISIIMNRFFQNQKNNLEMLVKIGQQYEGMLSEMIIRDSAKIREVVNNKMLLIDIKQGKELYEIMSALLTEFNVLKR